MRLLLIQSKMEIRRLFRNPYFLFWSLTMPILFYFLFTKVFTSGYEDAQLWEAHYLISMTAFSVMGSSIMTQGIRLVEERAQGWTLLMRVTPLPSVTYFLARMISQTVIHLFTILVIFTAGGIGNGVTMRASEWLLSGAWILLGALPFLAIGNLVGTMKKVDTASGVSNVLYMVLAFTGGLWMPMETLPDFMQTLGKWLPAYHFGSGGWEIIRGNSPEVENILVLSAYLVLFVILSSYIRRKQEAVV